MNFQKAIIESPQNKNKFMEVIAMSNIFSVLEKHFEILQSQDAIIKKRNGVVKLDFPNYGVSAVFETKDDFDCSTILTLAKETTIEYTVYSIESYLETLFTCKIDCFTNKNLWFTFDIEETSDNETVLIKGCLGKKII